MSNRWSHHLRRELRPPEELQQAASEHEWDARMETARELRESLRTAPPSPGIEDCSMRPDLHVHPIIFEQRYARKAAASPSSPRGQGRGVHAVVLVHGFQGNACDMNLIRNNFALAYPRALYVCSCVNEDDMDIGMEEMGQRLAEEVQQFVSTVVPAEPGLERLSFITHSAGGVIVRCALPHLREFHAKLWTFMSLAAPHLGYMRGASTLFKTGLWVVKKFRRSRCLEELSMTDSPELTDCLIWRLSKTPGLEYFMNVVLVSSVQDGYAPLESARIELPCSSSGDGSLGSTYQAMVRNILGRVNPGRVIRLEVNFCLGDLGLDAVTGRAAHIQLIDNQLLLRLLAQTHGCLLSEGGPDIPA